MGKGAPDYTRVTEIRGEDPTGELVTLAVDANGQLYGIIKGIDGTTLRTIAVDASGRIIMVPYGVTSISGTATVTQAEKDREVQGKDGVTLRTLAVDASGQLIMVPRGQSGNYMSVDASGFMTSVMKGVDGVTLRTVAVDSTGKILGVLQGDYAGSLKTLAVDSQGRMLAVLTDPEDVFGNPHYMGAAELAARLGCISLFERRGNVIFMDDFESGLVHWNTEVAGTSAEVTLSAVAALSGRYSVKLKGGSDGARRARITHQEPFPVLSKIGMELVVCLETPIDKLDLWVAFYDGTYVYWGGCQLDVTNSQLKYYDKNGVAQILATGYNLYRARNLFHHFKLVGNAVSKMYTHLIVNETIYNLSAYELHKIEENTSPRIEVFIESFSPAGTPQHCYVDNVILTQNESA